MSEDLLQDEVIEDNDEIESADLETDIGDNQDNKPDEPVISDGAQKAINKKHFEARQAERERDAEKERGDALERRLAELEQAQTAPSAIPPMPDPYDDDYDQKMSVRDAAIGERAGYDARQTLAQETQQTSQLAAQQKAVDDLNKASNDYVTRGIDYGLTPDAIENAGKIVSTYGLNAELQKVLLSDPEGSLIVQHLASNPHEIDALNGLSMYQVGTYINETVRPKAVELKPRSSNAPNPATRLDGGGIDVDAGKAVYSKGATFK